MKFVERRGRGGPSGRRGRRGVSEVVSTLMMVAIVVALGVVVFTFASNGIGTMTQGFSGMMADQGSAVSERLSLQQAAFTLPGAGGVGVLALDGSATNQVAGSSTSIAASLTTSSASDVVVAYVSPADTGATAPPAVSGLSGGGLSWHHRATAPSETYTISYYVPVTITNNQASATTSGFQEAVTINPSLYSSLEAADLGNLRFCAVSTYPCPGGDLLYSWMESCGTTPCSSATTATFWVNLGSNTVGASGTLTIYVVFYPTSTEFDGVYAGEAPNLSGTYGQYDNGANVFQGYFRGDSTSGWTVAGSAGSTATAPAGNPAFGSDAYYANSANGDYEYVNANIPTSPNVVIQFYVYSNGLGDFFYTASSSGAGTMTRLDTRAGQTSGLALTRSWTSWNCPATSTQLSPDTWYLFTVDISGGQISDSYSTALSYSSAGTTMNALSSTYTDSCGGGTETYAYNGGYIGLVGDALGSSYVTYASGVVVRSYPPGGVMPSSSAGSLSTVSDTTDLEEWYAVAPSPLTATTITATLSSADTAATWIAVFGVSGANTTSPFDPNVSVPATVSGTSPSASVSTSNVNDMLLFGCSAQAGGMAAGFTGVFSNSYSPNPGELVGYHTVSATQAGVTVACGTNAYGSEVADALVAYSAASGADLYIQNVGSLPVTIVSVYVVDQSTNTFVAQFEMSTTLNVGGVVELPHTTLAFVPYHGHAYSFTVTTSRGNSVTFYSRAN